MGKGSLAVLILIILAGSAIGFFIRGLWIQDAGEVKLSLSFGAILMLLFIVLFLCLYLARVRTGEPI